VVGVVASVPDSSPPAFACAGTGTATCMLHPKDMSSDSDDKRTPPNRRAASPRTSCCRGSSSASTSGSGMPARCAALSSLLSWISFHSLASVLCVEGVVVVGVRSGWCCCVKSAAAASAAALRKNARTTKHNTHLRQLICVHAAGGGCVLLQWIMVRMQVRRTPSEVRSLGLDHRLRFKKRQRAPRRRRKPLHPIQPTSSPALPLGG